MSEEWLTDAEAEEFFRSLRPMSIGKAQAEVRAARASGEVRLELVEPAADPVYYLISDDVFLGMDVRPGARNKGGITQDDLRRLNKDDLLYWFNQRYPPPPAPPARAPREQVDRDAAKRVINVLYSTLPDARKLPNKKLHAEVNGHLKANGEKALSLDTVVRAAKEIRTAAANALR
jgi:hypothetical protein